MKVKTFLNNNVGNYKSITINKMIIKFDITKERAELIYKKWRKEYLMDYTPVIELNNDYFYYKNKYKRWTYKERINVVKLKESGLTIKYIAELYNVSIRAITNVLDSMSKYYSK